MSKRRIIAYALTAETLTIVLLIVPALAFHWVINWAGVGVPLWGSYALMLGMYLLNERIRDNVNKYAAARDLDAIMAKYPRVFDRKSTGGPPVEDIEKEEGRRQ